MKKLITTTAALGLLAASSIAGACGTSSWSSVSGTAPTVGGPSDPVDVPRFEGICAMQADSGTQFVQDNSPAGEGTMIVRFYFRAESTNGKGGGTTIYETYAEDAASTPVYTVTADGTNVTVTPASGSPATAAMSAGVWNLVEISWAAGGDISLWVNTDSSQTASATGSDSNGTGVIESARLGAVAGLGGFTAIQFDAYDSRRSQLVGGLCQCDANGDGTINVVDASLVVAERLGQNTGTGVPDCNGDAAINVVDASRIVNIRLGPTSGSCP